MHGFVLLIIIPFAYLYPELKYRCLRLPHDQEWTSGTVAVQHLQENAAIIGVLPNQKEIKNKE